MPVIRISKKRGLDIDLSVVYGAFSGVVCPAAVVVVVRFDIQNIHISRVLHDFLLLIYYLSFNFVICERVSCVPFVICARLLYLI